MSLQKTFLERSRIQNIYLIEQKRGFRGCGTLIVHDAMIDPIRGTKSISDVICRELRSVKGIMQSPLVSSFHLDAGECILAIDGDKPIHPVLQHIGISAWPGELINCHTISQLTGTASLWKAINIFILFGRKIGPHNTCSLFSEYQSGLL